MENSSIWICVVVALCILLLPTLYYWISALASGVWINPVQLVLMVLRRVPRRIIVNSLIESKQAGLKGIGRTDLEAHYMSGGHVTELVHALVSANKAGIGLSFNEAAAIDLAGRDILEAVHTSVNPKVIDTPAVEAVAKDGIQVIVKARITIKSDIRALVGGAGEDTILARVGECIVTSIGASESHKAIMEKPDTISKMVMNKGLDENTAYKILSVDIADVDLGQNVGANLQIDRANADKNIAQSKAEERRAMAIALEQEMCAEKVRAEAAVPMALAKALENGTISFVDYYKLKNLQADTAMREQLGGVDAKVGNKVIPTIDVNQPGKDFFEQ